MRFFNKLFISILALLTLAIVLTEYYIVAQNLDNNLNNKVEMAVNQHQLVTFAIQSDYLSSVNSAGINNSTLSDIVENAVASMDVMADLYDIANEEAIYRNHDIDTSKLEAKKDEIVYTIINSDNSRFIVIRNTFDVAGLTFTLSTVTNVDSVYTEAQEMMSQCTWIFVIIIGVGAAFAFMIAIYVSRPVQQLTKVGKAFTEGDYTGRATMFPHDEIGELALVYNEMADTIEDKIEQLELAVKQREDFTAAFAHEMKTPMTSIIGYADTLYQKDLTADEARDAAGFILNEGMRLEALSFKLLELITLSNNDFMLEEINMKDFFKDVQETLVPVAQKRGINLRFDTDDAYCRIEYDLFKTMVLNLADNAMKSGTDEVAILTHNYGDEYLIAIVDRGRGIPAKELKRVTEAFYMVDKARSRKEHGAGLGLALCAKIADIHGSRLDIRSKEGQGTAIRLTLNVVQDQEDDDE